MIYLKDRDEWAVRSTKHTNYSDVVVWCYDLWGEYRIENFCDGDWSYCDGTYYGITTESNGMSFNDTRLYFSFKREEDAMFFALRWA